MDEQLGEMTDDQVMAEWEETHVDNLDLAAGEEPPAHASEYSMRHGAAHKELERRGYVYKPADGWVMTI